MIEETKNQSESPEAITLKINFRIPGRMPSVYAHHLLVHPGENEVSISFFEVVPPLMTADTREDQIKLLQETGLIADCVSRVLVSKNRFPSFVNAMQQVLEQITAEETTEETNADNSGDNQQD
jgi:hypothetical protein